MTIEIGNSITVGQQPTPGAETQSGVTQKNPNKAQAETGNPVESVKISENAQRVQQLTEAISDLPVVDSKRVAEMQQKIKSQELGILSKDSESRKEAAMKITSNMLFLDNSLPKSESFDAA